MVDKTSYLLCKVMEECAEIAQVASKAITFGLDSFHPSDSEKLQNFKKIRMEFNDLIGVMRMLEEIGVFNTANLIDEELIEAKIQKVTHFMEISRSLGKLELENKGECHGKS
jgi:NTP pyrophosphatase (non-canonical NTP hydrolase)